MSKAPDKDKWIMENRLWNTRMIVKAVKTNAKAAEILGIRAANIPQYVGPNPTRNIGDEMAAKIEEKFHLKPGSLDEPPPKEVSGSDPLLREISATMVHTRKEDKEFLLAMAEWLAKRAAETPAAKPGNILWPSVSNVTTDKNDEVGANFSNIVGSDESRHDQSRSSTKTGDRKNAGQRKKVGGG